MRRRLDQIPLDLTKVEVLPFSSRTAANSFSSGKTPIDRFLKNKAKKMIRRHEQRVFCAHVDGSPTAIGYYALQLGTDSVDDLPNANKSNYLQNKTAFPAVHLSHLGVDYRYQRQGLGEYLLMDVFSKVATIAEVAGFYALTLQSLDKDSTAFYKSLNFTEYSENLSNPKMLYPVEDILALIGISPYE